MTHMSDFLHSHPELAIKEEQLKELVEIVREKILASQEQFALSPKTDCDFLIKFIRCKKYQPDEAVKSIQRYYRNVYMNLDIVQGVHSRDFESIYVQNMTRLLKHKINGATVLCGKIGSWEPKVDSLKKLAGAMAFGIEELFTDMSTQVNGLLGILDVTGFTFRHAPHLTYGDVKFILKCFFEMFPIRFVGIHFVNVPTYFRPVYKLVMMMLPTKVRSRVSVHSDASSLAKTLDPQRLPISLGGVLTDDEAWDNEIVPRILKENKCYDSYWHDGGSSLRRSRTLSHKRSSVTLPSDM